MKRGGGGKTLETSSHCCLAPSATAASTTPTTSTTPTALFTIPGKSGATPAATGELDRLACVDQIRVALATRVGVGLARWTVE